jgi:hypothetical protein
MTTNTYIEWVVTFTTQSEGIRRTTEVTVNALTALTAIAEAHKRTSVDARYITSLDLRRR